MAAARFWRWLIVGELGCAAVLAWLVTAAYPSSRTAVVLLAMLMTPFALHLTVAGASSVVARLQLTPSQRGPWTEMIRAWLSETIASEWAMLVMSIEPWLRRGRHAGVANSPDRGRPVLLIHGIVCNRAVWRPLANALRKEGFGPIRAVNLEPLFADIDTHAQYVANEVRRLRQECNDARVALVTHSMGGLVARAALRQAGPEDISHIVTLAAPHHGTSFARLAGFRPCQQMRPDSTWLATLNSEQEGRFPVPISSICSLDDNLVAPAASARLAGADLFELRGIGHLSLLTARESIECALAALSQSRIGQQPCPT